MTRRLSFYDAIEHAVAIAMTRDERIIVIGEDVRMYHGPLHARFGSDRVLDAPISEAAFTGAGVAAALAGLHPIVEIVIVDFVGTAMDAVLNHMAKARAFSGGSFCCPMVIRMACGGGYGDGGQHEQALWGMLGGIPGLTVVVPSTPADAGGLMLSALQLEEPVIFLEHKLLSEFWLGHMGRGHRETVHFDVPDAGAIGEVADPIEPVPIGRAITRRTGRDLSIASLAVGVHRALQVAQQLAADGIEAEVIDLRTVRPLDANTVVESVARTGRLLVVDEDYREMGLSGELAAQVAEAGVAFRFARVCTEETIPYARELEDAVLPNVERIARAARQLVSR